MTHALPLWTIRGPRLGSFKWFAWAWMISIVSLALIVTGCSFASFVAAAEADLPVVIQMVSNLTSLAIPGFTLPLQAGGALALASLQILCGTPAPGAKQCDPTSLVGQYQTATDTATRMSLLQKCQAALLTANGHISSILQLASGLPPADGAAIVTGLGLALSTVTAILSMIPPSANPTVLGATLKKATMPPPADKLKLAFNTAVGGQYAAAVIH